MGANSSTNEKEVICGICNRHTNFQMYLAITCSHCNKSCEGYYHHDCFKHYHEEINGGGAFVCLRCNLSKAKAEIKELQEGNVIAGEV